MNAPLTCPNCGSVLSGADLQNPNCRYCGAAHPHIAQASAQVEAVKQAMAIGPGGVPNVLQGAVAPWMPYMQGPMPMGAPGPVIIPGAGSAPGAAPPMTGGPMGGGTPHNPFANPYANPYAAHQHGMQMAAGIQRGMTMIFVVVGVVIMMIVAGAVALIFLAR